MADLTLRPADHAPVPEKGALAVELVDHPLHGRLEPEGMAPKGQAAVGIHQLQGADTGVVVVTQGEARAEFPGLPRGFSVRARQQTAVRQCQPAPGKQKLSVEVNLQPSQNVLARDKQWIQVRPPRVGDRIRNNNWSSV